VDLDEVQDVDLKELKGVDDVLRNLEINIVLPLENDELATRFRLRSKRGVLLSGPHGTGKTTVGRALTVCWVANWQSDERSEKAARADCQSALRRSAAKLQPKTEVTESQTLPKLLAPWEMHAFGRRALVAGSRAACPAAPEPRARCVHRMHKRCTSDAHRSHACASGVHRLCIACASGGCARQPGTGPELGRAEP